MPPGNKNFDKTELIADIKTMSLEISFLCGANQGLQSDSGFIDENRNDSGEGPKGFGLKQPSNIQFYFNANLESEIVSDISSMLTEMNEILGRMTSSSEKMRTNDNSHLDLTTCPPNAVHFADSMRRPVRQALDIR